MKLARKRILSTLICTMFFAAVILTWYGLGFCSSLENSPYRFEYVLWKHTGVCLLSDNKVSWILTWESARSLGIVDKQINDVEAQFSPLHLHSTPQNKEQRFVLQQLRCEFADIHDGKTFNSHFERMTVGESSLPENLKIETIEFHWIGDWTNFIVVVNGKIKGKGFLKPV